jgi:hypothetical protein
MKRSIRSVIVGLSYVVVAQGQIFTQDFSGSSSLSDYVAATPNSGQWNAIGTSGGGTTVGIVAGTLQYTRDGANLGSFSRTTDFSPVPATLEYQFDLSVGGNTTHQTTAAVWQLGSGFGTANSAEANSAVYARFGLNLEATPGEFTVRDISTKADSAVFSGSQTISWFLNHSGSAISYTAPDGSVDSLGDNSADLWVGNTRALNDLAVLTDSQTMADMKFSFSQGSGTITMDNFNLAPISAVPEPEEYGVVTGLMLLGFAGWRKWRGAAS